MKIAAATILSVFLLVLGSEISFFWKKGADGGARYAELKKELDQAKDSYAKMQSDFDYYMNPDNLEKELRARFNYRLPGEKMIIIVPAASSTSQ